MEIKKNRRLEYKMVIRKFDLSWVRSLILVHTKAFYQVYPSRRVNNIYFDTKDLDCCLANIDGISLRHKVRYRWYGEEIDNLCGNFELKFKMNDLGWKVIKEIDKPVNLSSMTWGQIISLFRHNLDGLARLRFERNCFPVIINRYYREYYQSKDGLFRITLDHSQSVYDQRMHRAPNLRYPVPKNESIIIELKLPEGLRGQVNSITDELPFLVAQGSKYVSGLLRYR